MAQRTLTPKQRGELSKLKRTLRSGAGQQRITALFGTKELRGLILSHVGFYDQIQFNKVSKQWYIPLVATHMHRDIIASDSPKHVLVFVPSTYGDR